MPSDKFQNALCYAASSMWQSGHYAMLVRLCFHIPKCSSMSLAVIYHAMFSRPILVLPIKFHVVKIDTKGFSTVLVYTGNSGSGIKTQTESTIRIYIKFKMAAKTH